MTALNEWDHLYAGSCPDALHPHDRDPACPGCQQLAAAVPGPTSTPTG